MIIRPEEIEHFCRKCGNVEQSSIIQLPEESPTMLVCEQYVSPYGFYGTALALIGESKPYYHERTREIYILRMGRLRIRSRYFKNPALNEHILSEVGDVHVFNPGTIYCAEGVGGPAEVLVVTYPSSNQNDRHPFDGIFDQNSRELPVQPPV